MDPVTLGVVTAGLVAKKALEEVGGEAGKSSWAILSSVVDRLQDWFRRRGDAQGTKALDLVEAAPDSPRALEALAFHITAVAEDDSAAAGELSGLIEALQASAPPTVAKFVVQVQGQAKVGRFIQAESYHEHVD